MKTDDPSLQWIFENQPNVEDLNLPIAFDAETESWLKNEVAEHSELDYSRLRRRRGALWALANQPKALLLFVTLVSALIVILARLL